MLLPQNSKILIPAGVFLGIFLLILVFLNMALVGKNKTGEQQAASVTDSPARSAALPTKTPETAAGPAAKKTQRLTVSGGSPYPFDSAKFLSGYKIGEVIVRLSDLDYRYRLLADSLPAANDSERWQKVLGIVNGEAIIQNEGVNAGLFPAGFLDAKKTAQARDYIDKKLLTTVSLEKITVFFNNFINEGVTNPLIGIPAAKQIAYDTLSQLRQQLTAGQMTMSQAGAQIKNNSELEKVDIAWKVNAYQQYSRLKTGDTPFDAAILATVWHTPVNGITGILTGKNGNEEIYYCIIKVTGKNQGKFDSLEELLNQRKNEGLAFNL